MNKKVCLLLILVLIVSMTACGKKGETTKENGEKILMAEAESMIEDEVIPEFNRMGIEINGHELMGINPVESIRYSGGGTFDFYEIGYRLLPKDLKQAKRAIDMYKVQLRVDEDGWLIQDPKNSISGKTRAFISAYNDNGEFYELNRYYGTEYRDFIKGDKYNRKAFKEKIKYLYEEVEPAPVEAEYTLTIDDKVMSIGQNFKGKPALEEVEIKRAEPGDLMGVITRYKETWQTVGFRGETYCYFQKKNEPLLRMATTSGAARTPRGIGIGSTRDELFAAYDANNLVFSSKSFEGESFSSYAEQEGMLVGNEEWTCFGFTGGDETNYYISFYMKEDKVFAIEMGTGFDYKPFKKAEAEFALEAENLLDDHIDQTGVMKYDVTIPKIKEAVSSSNSMNAQIQTDFEPIINFSESGQYQVITTGFEYPWVQMNYGISNVGTVAILNIFSSYSSASGSGTDRYVHSYYYDTTCGARMSEEAALYKLGYTREELENYFKFKHGYAIDEMGEQVGTFDNLIFYFDETGEPMYIINGFQ